MRKQILTILILALASNLSAQIPSYVPTNGLVGWWPFNGNANDESGNGNNGTVNGATLTADRFSFNNNAFLFSRLVNNDILVSNSAQLNSLSNITISLWVNLSSYSELGQGGYNHIINKSDQSNTHHFILANNTNQLYFYFGSGNNVFTTNNLPPLFQWSHLALSYNFDGTQQSKCKFYINGILVDSMQTSIGLNTTNSDLRIGALGTESYNRVDGSIDDIGIWNRALSECEISDLYNSQLGSLNSTSTQIETAIDSYTWPVNGQTYTQSGSYVATIPNAAGCDSTITLDLTMSYTGLESLQLNPNKKLVKITDLNGKETPYRKNTVLLFIYEDGTVERAYVTE
jgi:hypothetical protein